MSNTIIADITVTDQVGAYRRDQRFLLRNDGMVIRYHRYGNTPWSTRPGSTTLGRASQAVIANPDTFATYIRTRKGWVIA